MAYALPRRLAIATVILASVAAAARAQDASAWDAQPHTAARFIAGATLKSANTDRLRAGIEIRLAPGWHTYWRYPGDSGVPPTFDFAGSANVKSVRVLWPAPERFADGAGGHSIGYIGDVVLPLRIAPRDAAKPASLKVRLGYAICSNVCIPVKADLSFALSGKGGAEEPALVAAEARVPRRVALGAATDTGLAILRVHREAGGTHARVVVDVRAPPKTPVELLVEGPTPDWALPPPEPTTSQTGSTPGTRRFAFALDGLPPGAHAAGAKLTFTAVSPNDAIEVVARLD